MMGSVQGLVRTGQTFGGTAVVLVRDMVVWTWPVVSCGRPEGSKHARGLSGRYVDIDRGQVMDLFGERVWRVLRSMEEDQGKEWARI